VQARYLRFFAPVTPGPALLRLLSCDAGTGAAAGDAMVAVAGGRIVGHAIAADRDTLPGTRTTDIGVVVADAWQGQGLGSVLMRAVIAAAQARGVTSIRMDVLPGNHRVLGMITGHWPEARMAHSRDCLTVNLQLPQPQHQQPPNRSPAPPTCSPAPPTRSPAPPTCSPVPSSCDMELHFQYVRGR